MSSIEDIRRRVNEIGKVATITEEMIRLGFITSADIASGKECKCGPSCPRRRGGEPRSEQDSRCLHEDPASRPRPHPGVQGGPMGPRGRCAMHRALIHLIGGPELEPIGATLPKWYRGPFDGSPNKV
jgi:hypothetical protein